MKQSLSYLKKFKKQLILGPMFKLIEAIFELLVPMLMAYIIDKGIQVDVNGAVIGGDKGLIIKTGALIVTMGVLGLCSSLVCQFFASRASQGYGTELRNAMYKHILHLPMEELDDIGSAKLENIMVNDINQLQLAVAMFIRLVVRAPFLVIGGVVCAFLISWKMGLIFLATLPLFCLVIFAVMKISSSKYFKIQGKLDTINRKTSEGLTGQRVIRVFNTQDKIIDDYKKETYDFYRESKTVNSVNAFLNPLTLIIVNAAIIAIIYFGGIQVNLGYLTQGNVIALVNYLNQIMLALIVVSNLVVIFTKASASLKRCNDIFEKKEIVNKDDQEIVFNENKPIIEFSDVSFRFLNSENDVLHDLSFTLNKGETLGVIGGTGSGKSTLMNLINGLYNPTKGDIRLFGIEYGKLSNKKIHEHISLASQKAYLFTGSIRKNFLMADETLNDVDIEKALKISNASFVEKYDDGIDHVLEEAGRNLSGGQKQRLSLARAVSLNRDLLILDDVTSALDNITTKKVLKNLFKIKNTKIIVSQRVNAIAHADKIMVLDNGTISGFGTHEDLLKNNKAYQQICASQMEVGDSNENA